MTIADALREAAARLSHTSDTARLDAEMLMAEALGVSRSDVLLRYMRDEVPPRFSALVERRAAHEPVAHILGRQEFYGREFKVTPDTLIPRADSELLVDTALALKPGPCRVLDMGTGTGALVITVLAESGGDGVATDRSTAALAVAAENAAAHGVQDTLRLEAADWTRPGWSDGLGRFDLILCNPPYVEEGALLAPDVRDYEPGSALFAGAEGLDDYRVIIPPLGKLLSPGGLVLLEIGASQAASVQRIAQDAGFDSVIKHDLAGRDRCAVLS